MKVKDVPGGKIFRHNDQYYLKADGIIQSNDTGFYALSHEDGKPALTQENANDVVELSDCVFTQKSRA